VKFGHLMDYFTSPQPSVTGEVPSSSVEVASVAPVRVLSYYWQTFLVILEREY